jgi:hypothetical protein
MIGITVYDATGFSGRIADNYIHDMNVGNEEHSDCINFANNGVFTGFVISSNKLTKWRDDAIDLAFAEAVIVEMNTIYSPAISTKKNNTGVKLNYNGNGNAVIRYNVFHSGNDCRHKNSYAVYNANNGSSGNQIYRNLIYDWSFGILLGANVDNNDIYHNTIIADYRGISFNDGVRKSDVQNNIIDGGVDGIDFSIGKLVHVVGGYNIFVRDNEPFIGTGSIYLNIDAADQYKTNPLFVGLFDYRLQSSSPAIDTGFNLGAPYNGNLEEKTSDIGAIEYVSLSPSPPSGFRRIR